MYDLIIKNGNLIDGTGKPAYNTDIAISGGKILKVYEHITDTAKDVIDATDLTATPGFIDSHSHNDNATMIEGFDADIWIFDETKIIDKADFTNSSERCEGLNYVILGGEIVVENAIYNGKRKGSFIKSVR